MEEGVVVHEKVDTGLNADSVEFCPYADQQDLVLCGVYQLQEDSTVNASDEPKSSSPTSQTRLGGVRVYSVSCTDGGPHFCPHSQVDMYGVLDIKWPGVRIHDKSLFGLVDAEGCFQVFHLLDKKSAPSLVAKETLSASSLGLSLAWDGGRDRAYSKAVCSDSAGYLTVFSVDSESTSTLTRWRAHDYEAWIAAFHDFDSNIVYSGGDDSLLKGWDIRDTTRPTFVSRRHSMGVCSIQSHPLEQHIYATGSYDEKLLIWDRRQQKCPLSDVNLGGGVWRIKWDPFQGQHILTATMYNGTHIVKADPSGASPPSIVAEHRDHNLAYGADWCRLDEDLARIDVASPPPAAEQEDDNDSNKNCDSDRGLSVTNFLIATCSFYDHSLHLWQWQQPGLK